MPLLNANKASQMLGIAPKTLRKWAKAGRIPVTILPNNNLRFDEAVITRWAENRTTKVRHYSSVAHALILVIGLAFLLGSCAKPLGACYENNFVGYGHTPKAIHGPKRQSY